MYMEMTTNIKKSSALSTSFVNKSYTTSYCTCIAFSSDGGLLINELIYMANSLYVMNLNYSYYHVL